MKNIRQGNAFSLTAPYYDVIYGNRHIANDAEIILDHARSARKKNGLTLLDMGCGTGVHALEFDRRGIRVTGIDRSPSMIRIAKEKALHMQSGARFLISDIQTYRPSHPYDIVISLFDVLSYMSTNDQVRAFFATMSNALSPGGICVFDCWYGPGVLLAHPKTMRQQYKSASDTVRRKKTPVISYEDNTVSVFHELSVRSESVSDTSIRETHIMRYFFYPELEIFTKEAGIQITSWGTLGFPMKKSKYPPWSVCFIGKKIR